MARLDKPLAYLQNMMGADTGSDSGDSSAPFRVRVDVPTFPPSTKSLKVGNYTIGASPECDLIIPEAPSDELALLHVRGPGEQHELVSLARGITVNGQVLGPQQRLILAVETVLNVGPTSITFTPRVNSFQRANDMFKTAAASVNTPRSLTVPGALLLIAVVCGLVAWYSSGGSNYNEMVYSAQPRIAGGILPGTPLITAEDTTREINRMLGAADLATQVSASSDGSQVVVEGAVNGNEERRLNEVLQSVSARSRIDIRSKVKPDPSTLVGSIAGISLSPTRYIVLRDGDRYRLGDLMPNGWRIEAIEEKRIIVARDGLRETLDLAP